MYRQAQLHRSCRLVSAPVPAPGASRQRSQRAAAAAAKTAIFRHAAQLNSDSDSDSDTNGSEDGSSESNDSNSHRESSQDNGIHDNGLQPGDSDLADASTPHLAMPTPTQQPPQQSVDHHHYQHKRPFCSSGLPSRKKAKPPVPRSPVSAVQETADPAGTGPMPAVRLDQRSHKIRPATTAFTRPTSPQPLKLLLIEAFAGTHPVGQVVRQIKSAGLQACLQVTAYVSIEIEDTNETMPLDGQLLGLSADRYLKCRGATHGDVGSLAVQQTVAEFVQRHLQAGTVEAVVVFGGPPCTEYVGVRPVDASITREARAARALQLAIDNVATAPGREAELSAEWERTTSDADRAAWREFAERRAADNTVKRFLWLYKKIEARCNRYAVKCYMLMENPYSTAERGLWNRAFMKADHLLDLPDQPRADAIAHNPADGAWLYSKFNNWCMYDPAHPKKPTVVFTNLTGFPSLRCNHGQRPHRTTVNGRSNTADRAAWPLGFVRMALVTVVAELKPELVQRTRALLGLEQNGRSRGQPQVLAPPPRDQPSHLGNTSGLGRSATPVQVAPGQRAAQQDKDRIIHVTGTIARALAGQQAMVRTATHAPAAAVAEEDNAIIIDSSSESESSESSESEPESSEFDDGLDISDYEWDDNYLPSQ